MVQGAKMSHRIEVIGYVKNGPVEDLPYEIIPSGNEYAVYKEIMGCRILIGVRSTFHDVAEMIRLRHASKYKLISIRIPKTSRPL